MNSHRRKIVQLGNRKRTVARHARTRRRTSTLIELVAVIAIIVILAALLLPALTRAKGKARTIQTGHQGATKLSLGAAYTRCNTRHGTAPEGPPHPFGRCPTVTEVRQNLFS